MTDTQNLIHKVEKNERRYRLFQTLFMVVVLIILGVVLYNNNRLQAATNQSLKNQRTILEQQTATAKTESDNVNAKLNEQNRVLLCVADFFAIPNRTTLAINDLNNCAFSRTGSSTPASKSSVPVPANVPQNQTKPTPTTASGTPQSPSTSKLLPKTVQKSPPQGLVQQLFDKVKSIL